MTLKCSLQIISTLSGLTLWGASGQAFATTLGNPGAYVGDGDTRVSLQVHGEGPPGGLTGLPAKVIRFDLIPKDNLGVFVDASWSNALADKLGGIRNRAWTVGAGGRASVHPWRGVGFGVIGHATYGEDWESAPYYLMGDTTDLVSVTSGSVTTVTTEPTTGTLDEPFFPSWAYGEVTNHNQRIVTRGAAYIIFGQPGSGVYGWVGAHATITGTFPVNSSDQLAVWTWSTGPGQKAGASIGAELHSTPILGLGDPRERRLSVGLEAHYVDVSGATIWVGYAF